MTQKKRRNELRKFNHKLISISIGMALPTLADDLFARSGLWETLYSRFAKAYANQLASSEIAFLNEVRAKQKEAISKTFYAISRIPQKYKISQRPVKDPLNWFGLAARYLEKNHPPQKVIEVMKANYATVFLELAHFSPDLPEFREFFLLENKKILGTDNLIKHTGILLYEKAEKKSLIELSRLIKRAYVLLTQHSLLDKKKDALLNNVIKNSSNAIAFSTTHFLFILMFVISACAIRYFLLDPLIDHIDKKYFHKINETLSPTEIESENKKLLSQHKVKMGFMAIFMIAALIFSINQFIHNEKESPALYVFILSTASMLLFDCIHLYQLGKEEYERFHRNRKILAYFNEALAYAKPKCEMKDDQLIFRSNDSAPRRVNKIVRNILKNSTEVRGENNDEFLIISSNLPKKEAKIIHDEIKTALEDQLNQSEEKLPYFFPELPREKKQKLKGKKPVAAKSELKLFSAKPERKIEIPPELEGKGEVVERENSFLMFMWVPEFLKEKVSEMAKGREIRFAKKHRQNGLKMSKGAKHTFAMKDPNTRERMPGPESGPVTLTVNGKPREMDSCVMTETIKKRNSR